MVLGWCDGCVQIASGRLNLKKKISQNSNSSFLDANRFPSKRAYTAQRAVEREKYMEIESTKRMRTSLNFLGSSNKVHFNAALSWSRTIFLHFVFRRMNKLKQNTNWSSLYEELNVTSMHGIPHSEFMANYVLNRFAWRMNKFFARFFSFFFIFSICHLFTVSLRCNMKCVWERVRQRENE